MSETDDDFREKLSKSAAVRALQAEGEVAQLLRRLGWTTSHGVYYDDPLTSKRREVDVVATQEWVGPHPDFHRVRLKLIVECKSMSGFHLVVREYPALTPCELAQWWIGDDSVVLDVVQGLSSYGLAEIQAAQLLRYCRGKALRLRAELLAPPLPPNTIMLGQTFKETNIGTDKDLDNSVLWRAIQTLLSAGEAFGRDSVDAALMDLRPAFVADHVESSQTLPTVTRVFDELLRTREALHFVVVAEASIWRSRHDELEPAQFCRLELSNKAHDRMAWLDVVSRSHVTNFLSDLTAHYVSAMQALKAAQQPVSLG